MATFTYTSAGYEYALFNINNQLVSRPLLHGEKRLKTPFNNEPLEYWRATVLAAVLNKPLLAVDIPASRARMVVLSAHDADLGSMFYELNKSSYTALKGYYVDRRRLVDVDAAVRNVLGRKEEVFAELSKLGVPAQYLTLLRQRVESPTYSHRVSGICGVLYLSAIIFTESNQ